MNEQLQAELTKIVTNINNGAESAWEFIKGQTPGVVQQLLLWHGIKNFIFFMTSIIFIIACAVGGIKLSKMGSKWWDNSSYGGSPGVYIPAGLCFMAIFPISLFGLNLVWLQIWIAPKVWLLEYIAKMVK